jgi:sugar-specific transcriptional regulator TrmB
MKTKKLEKEVFDLKSKLLNKQGDLIKNIEDKFESQLTEFKKEADKKLELTKKETEKVVSNMSYDFKDIQDKLGKLVKQK